MSLDVHSQNSDFQGRRNERKTIIPFRGQTNDIMTLLDKVGLGNHGSAWLSLAQPDVKQLGGPAQFRKTGHGPAHKYIL